MGSTPPPTSNKHYCAGQVARASPDAPGLSEDVIAFGPLRVLYQPEAGD